MKVSLGGKLSEMKLFHYVQTIFLRVKILPCRPLKVQRDFALVIKSVDLQHPGITRCVCLCVCVVGRGVSEHSVVLNKIKQSVSSGWW